MKKFKKAVALLLAVSLVAMSGMMAFADGEDSVPADNGIVSGDEQDGTSDAPDAAGTTEPQSSPDDADNDGDLTTPDTPADTNDGNNGDQQGAAGGETGNGDASSGDSSEPPVTENPDPVTDQETLLKAIENAKDGETIILANDITLTNAIRCLGNRKNITIDGGGHTISRGDGFAAVQDSARSTYNPAMIEWDGTLTLLNITLDDNGKTAGSRYAQATTDGNGGNGDTVQDAIIACYDGDGDKIILGGGAVLKNYGGMSAVRLSGGTLIMEAGSAIVGSKDFNNKGGGIGAAGAVWMQGGSFIMEQGAEIKDMYGRAVYADGGSATIDGTISNIVPNKYMWNANGATAVVETGIHVRNGAEITFGGVIDGNGNAATAVQLSGDSFTMKDGAVIKNLQSGISMSGGKLYMDGEITGLKENGQVLNLQGGETVIGPNGNIHHNVVGRTSIYFQQKKLEVYGKIHHNYSNDKSGGIEVNNNCWGECIMYPGAEIKDNYAKEHGGGVMVCNGTFTMLGGEISGNVAGMNGGGVCVRRGGQFVMKDGKISNNVSAQAGGGIAVDSSEYTQLPTLANLIGGEVTDNQMYANVVTDANTHDVSFSNGQYNDLSFYGGIGTLENGKEKYLEIGADMIAFRGVYMTTDAKTVTVTDGTKLGNASKADVDALSAQAAADGFAAPLATLWAHKENGTAVTMAGLKLVENKPVYVLAKVGETITKIPAVAEDGIVKFNLADTGAEGCALAVVQPDNANGTLELSTEITQLKEHKDQEEDYTITYQLSFTPTSAAGAVESVSVTIESPLQAENKTVSLTKQTDGTWAGTWTGTLKAEDFQAGQSILTGSVAAITAGEADTAPVYSNVVETPMVALEQYTVSFDSNGGSAVEPQTVIEGEKAEKPADPAREGYTFIGWFLEGKAYNFSAPVTGNITLTAKWTSNYVPPVGPIDPVDPQPIPPDDPLEDPDDPTVNPQPLPPDDPLEDPGDQHQPLPDDEHLADAPDAEKAADPDQPKTGDEAPLMGLTAVLLVSAGALGAICVRRRKTDK